MSHPIDPLVVEAFTTAVTTTFEQLAGVVFEVAEVPDTMPRLPADFSSAYLELQRTIPGVVAIEMPPTLLATLASRSFPTADEPAAELLDDALREWLNVIAGQAKTLLKGTSYHYMLSLPQSGYHAFQMNEIESSFSIRFEASEGTMILRILLAP